jgi:3-hydroxyacyl-CoA dehydrogenase, NAD binding domain
VAATDIAPNAEAALRHFVDDAWPALANFGLVPGASRERLTFSADLHKAISGADFVQENGPERPDFKIKLFADLDVNLPVTTILASSSSGLPMSVIQSRLQESGSLRYRPSLQSSALDATRGSSRRREHKSRHHCSNDGLLRVARQEAHPTSAKR